MRYCYVSVYRLPGHKKGVKRDRGSLSGDKGAGAGLRTVILDSAEGVWCVVCACVCVCVCVCVGVWCVCVCVCGVLLPIRLCCCKYYLSLRFHYICPILFLLDILSHLSELFAFISTNLLLITNYS